MHVNARIGEGLLGRHVTLIGAKKMGVHPSMSSHPSLTLAPFAISMATLANASKKPSSFLHSTTARTSSHAVTPSAFKPPDARVWGALLPPIISSYLIEGAGTAVRMGVRIGLAAAEVALVDVPRRDSGRETPTEAERESGREAVGAYRESSVSESIRDRHVGWGGEVMVVWDFTHRANKNRKGRWGDCIDLI